MTTLDGKLNLPERMLEQYTPLELIGSGGGGEVYLAYYKNLKMNVVIKRTKKSVKNVLGEGTETNLLKGLSHTYIPTIYDHVVENGEEYTVMSFVEGRDIQQLMDEGKRFTQTQLIKYAKQLCEAVNYLHTRRQPVIHRDIKPGNIMLKDDDDICLIDFNISGTQDNNVVVGFSRGYASPEQCAAKREYDAAKLAYRKAMEAAGKRPTRSGFRFNPTIKVDVRSDIYSIGAALYFMASGVKPDVEYIHNRPIEQIVPNISEGFAYIINKAMALKPEDRFQSVAEMLKAFEDIGKRDKRYQNMVRRQTMTIVLFIAMAAVSAVVAFLGFNMLKGEKAADKYSAALDLYNSRQYEQAISYILKDALKDTSAYDKVTAGNLYYIAANSSYQLGEYRSAIELYETAISFDNSNAECYASYAVALVKDGQIENAYKTAEMAEAAGISQQELNFVKAEISSAEGDYAAADEYYRLCTETEDEYFAARAYNAWGLSYESRPAYFTDSSLISQNIAMLEEAVKNIKSAHNVVLYQQLAQAYRDMFALTGGGKYLTKAIDNLQHLADSNQASLNVYLDLAYLQEENGSYSQSRSTCMAAIEKYGENYLVYKQLAFLEVAIQGANPAQSRSYADFAQYYEKTVLLMEAAGVHVDADADMRLLKDNYDALKLGGFI